MIAALLSALALLLQPPPPAEPAEARLVAALVAALDEDDVETRQHLASALARLPAQSELVAALSNPSAKLQAGAAYALGLRRYPTAESAEQALAALVPLLKSPGVEVRRQTALAVDRVLQARRERRPAPVVPTAPAPLARQVPAGGR